jgi:hypothetical protein
MADDVEAPLTGEGDATADLRAVELASGKKVFPVRLDLGAGTAEALAAGTVPVSGTVAVTGPLTDAQLRAVAVPVSGALSTAPSVTASANVAGSPVSVGTGAPVTVLAAFAGRKMATIIPEGDVYMTLGGTAANTDAKLPAYTPFNLSGYSGAVSMLSVAGTVNVNVWEF